MKEKETGRKEPLFRLARRDELPFYRSCGIRIAAVLLALVVCGVLLYFLTKENALSVYRTMLYGALGSSRKCWVTIRETFILLGVAVALTPAFKMKFWNIGAEGQILAGALATSAVMIYGSNLPTPVLFLCMIGASVLAGLLWGLGPAVCKAKWNTNETLFTLMMNYIAIQLASFFSVFWEAVKGSGTIGVINKTTKAGWLPTDLCSSLFGRYNFAWIALIVLFITVMVHLYMKYSKQGFEISVVGESTNTAKYAGMHVKKIIIRTMMISGALAGLMGFLIVSGSSHTVSTTTGGSRGFTAIIVAWLANFNPAVMLVISFFLCVLGQGASQIATDYNLNESASDVVCGIVLFFILACELFARYRVIVRKGKEEKA